jgi:hypothetical protein
MTEGLQNRTSGRARRESHYTAEASGHTSVEPKKPIGRREGGFGKLFDIGRKRNTGRYRDGEPSDLPDPRNDFRSRNMICFVVHHTVATRVGDRFADSAACARYHPYAISQPPHASFSAVPYIAEKKRPRAGRGRFIGPSPQSLLSLRRRPRRRLLRPWGLRSHCQLLEQSSGACRRWQSSRGRPWRCR